MNARRAAWAAAACATVTASVLVVVGLGRSEAAPARTSGPLVRFEGTTAVWDHTGLPRIRSDRWEDQYLINVGRDNSGDSTPARLDRPGRTPLVYTDLHGEYSWSVTVGIGGKELAHGTVWFGPRRV